MSLLVVFIQKEHKKGNNIKIKGDSRSNTNTTHAEGCSIHSVQTFIQARPFAFYKT